ncbi:hypothetical protein F4777DRAFT_239184 [Nemania sp. FL0916]|nr:hypothetical protein F4777DRAFT_239184 [Nemania sp. FL0916]
MDNYFTPIGSDLFFGDLDFAPTGRPAPSNQTEGQGQADDTSPQFDKNLSWWPDDAQNDDLTSGGLMPDCLHILHGSQDAFLPQSCPSSHNVQSLHHAAPLPISGATPNNLYTPVAWPHTSHQFNSIANTFQQQSPGHSAALRGSIRDDYDFRPEAHHVPSLMDSFGDDSDVTTPFLPLHNQFSSADLGRLSCPPNEDTESIAGSQASCNSKCISSVCENENCSVTGTPCDDPTCVENMPMAEMPLLSTPASAQGPLGPMLFHQPHHQPCNHTESEHLVARTLGELRIPGELDVHGKTPNLHDFDYGIVSQPCTQFYGHSFDAYTTKPSQPFANVEDPSANPPMPLQPGTPVAKISDETSGSNMHICQWITNNDMRPNEKMICGAEFTNTKDLHEHICGSHVEKLTSQSGFTCLWDGCSRDRPFSMRGKLRRHISTHSVYKPFNCDICNTGFSGLQALQQHERIHTGQKPFECPVPGCGKAFKQKSALKMHERTHTGEKPLKCEYCGRTFPESSNLSKHRKTHLAKGNNYICSDIVKGTPCGKSFRRLDQLRRHRQTHLKAEKKRAELEGSASAAASISGDILDLEQMPDPLGQAQ